MNKISLAAILCLSSIGCNAQYEQFSWLVGKWKLQNKNVFEAWAVSSDKSLEGSSYKVTGTDTTFNEQIRIVSEGNSFHYIPDVAGSQGQVYFRIIHYDETSFVAENQDHDFPKVIRYKKKQDEGNISMEAIIEGNGKNISYTFEKVE